MVEGLLQIVRVAETFGYQAAIGIDQPGNTGKVISRMEESPVFPAGHLRDLPNGSWSPERNSAPEHRPVARPTVLVDITTIVQGIARNIGERIAQIPVTVQTRSFHVQPAKPLTFPISAGHPH